jgi:arylsulfatase A-like enzyme
MRRLIALVATIAFAVVLLSGVFKGDGISMAAAQTASNPNIVFILVDDMRKDDLNYMPKTRRLLRDEGITFNNAFVSNPICCPSRATIMRGQYAHNSGVWINTNSSIGGWEAYVSKGYENDGVNTNNNVATTLKSAGYRTALIGKYLNQYQGTTKPPGWDKWFAALHPTINNYYNYYINNNGTVTHFGTSDSNYKTDVLRRQTKSFIANNATQPFFAYVAPIAPHLPSTPAPRHAHTFDGEKAPRLPSFNEQDIADKPSWLRQMSKLTPTQIAEIDNRHENRVETLQAVDGVVEGVVNSLNEAGVMNNTYIFFTSDNGWFHGEHRIPREKYRPYEEDIRVPLVVRGPGVAPGCAIGDLICRTTSNLALNTDYFPTFTELAGTQTPSYVDGRSLVPVLFGSATTWRAAILVEGPQYNSVPPYSGIRTLDTNTQRKYVEYEGSSETEMYYLGDDPYERFNKTVPPTRLASRLQALKTCRPEPQDIDSTTVPCYVAEDGP